MFRSRWFWLALVVVAVLGFVWFRSRSKSEQPRFRTATVERGGLCATVSATGTVKPVTQVEVGSQVSGTVIRLGADYNSHVRSGQVLCQLDPSSFEARLAQADAAVARADAALREAERQYRRSQDLVKDNYVSQADVETAESNVAQRKADLQQARAQQQVARVDVQNTTIRSPIDGVVISRSIDVGQTVAASLQAPKLFVIANDLAHMQVETNIDEADIGRIHANLPVEFTVDAFSEATFRGEVSQVRLEPITQQNVVTYTTVIQTRNDDLRLRPGMTANVSVITDTREGVLKVPNAALRFRPAGAGGGREGAGAGARGGNGATPGAGSGAPGGRGGAPAGGAPRRSIAFALPSLVGTAWAQGEPGGPPPGAAPPGAPGANRFDDDPVVRDIRARVQKGELTREQARELIRRHYEAVGGGPRPGGPPVGARGERIGGAPPAGAPPVREGARPGMAPPSGGAAAGAARVRPEGAPTEGRGAREPVGQAGAMGGGMRGVNADGPGAMKPGTVYVLRAGKPVPVKVMTGITDGTMTELASRELKEGDAVIVGTEQAASGGNRNLQPPPGMGGPRFGPPGGRR